MTESARKRGGSRWYYILLLPLFVTASCSDESLSLFFDIPPPTEEEKAAEAADAAKQAAEARAAAAQAGEAVVVEEEGPPPEIEATVDWEKASELLPKDDLDEVDWMAALREGVIKPRTHIAGQPDPKVLHFKWDFYFAGPDQESDAYFPHSAHTEWLNCESCHPAIFPYRELGNDPSGRYNIAMDQVFEGEYCGKCHGTVAFSLDSCTRCHTKM